MRHLIARLRADDDGFVMIVVVLSLMIVMTIVGVTLQVAGGADSTASGGQGSGDVHAARYDRESKRAYAAAEAGVQWYAAQFGSDPNYWTTCTTGPAPQGLPKAPVNNRWNSSGTDPRQWMRVPGSNDPAIPGSGEYYTVELIPRTPGTPCSTSSPETTLLDGTGRSFRIVVTGSEGDPNGPICTTRKCPKRSITATFRRSSFLDYLWYTDYEGSDPLVSLVMNKLPAATTTQTSPAGGTDYQSWWSGHCVKHHWEGRDEPTNVATFSYSFFYYSGSTKLTKSGSTTLGCGALAFGDDAFNGPVHSEDSLRLCGQGLAPNTAGSAFGRNALDAVEVANGNPDVTDGGAAGSPTGYPSTYACLPSPFSPVVTWRGTRNLVANAMPMPTSNAALQSKAGGAYLATGRTTIVLQGTTVKIGATSYPWPSNGVIYVQDDPATCPAGTARFKPTDPQSTNAGCGDAYVSGNYSQPLTIAAANDVVVNGSVTNNVPSSSTVMLGLIGNHNVRIWHPVANQPTRYDSNGNCTSAESAGLGNVRIDAAILALQGSFMVDSFECGATPQGTLTVNGAIVQGFRGGVGQLNPNTGVLRSGYYKNYTYDDRFHARNPPEFLDPATTSWNIVKVTEQTGAY